MGSFTFQLPQILFCFHRQSSNLSMWTTFQKLFNGNVGQVLEQKDERDMKAELRGLKLHKSLGHCLGQQPFSVREGINIFLAGFVPTENLRFRDESLTFKRTQESAEEIETYQRYKYRYHEQNHREISS
ncbi:hypothetical protein HU200_038266 [Digitaria exilis]|uniref:Uncharacterized protein n=1 Tax=Digitaria exilis TaxID=1010633 RepID=A0A835BD52_9POAL|nr:hypothetical protein HU200_038266 [Digitaria exilis]